MIDEIGSWISSYFVQEWIAGVLTAISSELTQNEVGSVESMLENLSDRYPGENMVVSCDPATGRCARVKRYGNFRVYVGASGNWDVRNACAFSGDFNETAQGKVCFN